MALTTSNIVFDGADPIHLAPFWAAALDDVTNTEAPDQTWVYHPTGQRPRLLLNKVPKPKLVKNRIQLDLGTDVMDLEVKRLVQLGAQKLRFIDEAGQQGWVMADPEGNEFCIP